MKVNIEIKVPAIPNYIILSSDAKIHISKLSEKELRKIGNDWTEELVRIAKQGNSIR